MNSAQSDDELLKKIAAAMIENPRYTIKEIAQASGISNATLHRFCGTRENLELLLIQHGEDILSTIIKVANKDYDDYIDGLRELTDVHYHNHEILQVFFSLQTTCTSRDYTAYFKAMDNFFLRGQKKGVFRIDFNVSFLTTAFTSCIYGLINAEHQGRIAKIGMEESFEHFFLSGIKN